MDIKSSFSKINSKFIIQIISSYIKDENFLYKLVQYSKSCQKKLELDKFDYKLKRLNVIEKYLIDSDRIKMNTFENDLSKYDIKSQDIQSNVIEYFKRIINQKNREFSIRLDSPLFDILKKENFFEENFKIYIGSNDIHKKIIIGKDNSLFNLLKNESYFYEMFKVSDDPNTDNEFTIMNFDKIKELNLHYYSFEIEVEDNDANEILLKYFQKGEINITKIKKLLLDIKRSDKEEDRRAFLRNLKDIFSLNINENKLSYLNINLHEKELNINENFIDIINIKPEDELKVNNFQLLEFLSLSNLKFEKVYKFNLSNLKTLKLQNCHNIDFEEKSLLNLKTLSLIYCTIQRGNNSLLQFPEVENIVLNYYINYYESIIDFQSLTKLKSFEGNTSNFLLLKNNSLEKVKITHTYRGEGLFLYINGLIEGSEEKDLTKIKEGFEIKDKETEIYITNVWSDYLNEKEKEKKSIEKLLSMKGLKELNLYFKLNPDEIAEIKGINYDLEKLELEHINFKKECNKINYFGNFQNKFPNINKLKIYDLYEHFAEGSKSFQIEENNNSKINSIDFTIQNNDADGKIQFYCGPYNKLESIKIFYDCHLKDLNKSFPIFYDKCPIIFESLKYLYLKIQQLENINLISNIDCLPNLINFSLIIKEYDKIEENIFNISINKILSLKSVKYIFVSRNDSYDNFYSDNELKEKFPVIDLTKYFEVIIRKRKNKK